MTETHEDIIQRHKKEKKDLQNQITGLKKQCSGNKAKRKQVNSKCVDLEESLNHKHEQELKECEGLGDLEDDEFSPEKLLEQLELKQREETQTEEVSKEIRQENDTADQPKKRRNRQREKLAKREAEIAKIKEEAQREAMEQPDLKKMEQETLDKIFEMNNVVPVDIQPDGHCLFASILDQLKYRHGKAETSKDYQFPSESSSLNSKPLTEWTVSDLRLLAANHVRDHKDDFIPYLFDESTMQLLDIDEYTKEIETTAKWGGDVELIALAKVLNCGISIIFSGRSTLKINEEECENTKRTPDLKLVYYKHTYALGEHYNSLRDL